MSVTLSLKGVLIGILLIALIVLTVFLIVLVSKLTDTLKKANAIIDGGMGAATSAAEGVSNFKSDVKEKFGFVGRLFKKGSDLVLGVANKIIK